MTHADKLHLDRYGFIVSEAEAHLRAARTKRTPGQVKREQRHVAKWRRMLGASRWGGSMAHACHGVLRQINRADYPKCECSRCGLHWSRLEASICGLVMVNS